MPISPGPDEGGASRLEEGRLRKGEGEIYERICI